MRKGTTNYVLDVAALAAMLLITATGLLMKFVLPPGSGNRTVWGVSRHDWGGVHFWIAVTLVVLLAVHLALHWSWVCVSTRKLAARRSGPSRLRSPRDAGYGVFFLVAIVASLAGFVVAARGSVVVPAGGSDSHETEQARDGGRTAGGGAGRVSSNR